MDYFDQMWSRLATLGKLVGKAPNQYLGHTAIMKLTYFLQVLKKVPLGYDFRFYYYGPYDSDVLGDLNYAECLGVVNSEVEYYPKGGYGYRVSRGKAADEIDEKAKDFLKKYEDDINWVIQKFGNRNASQLELVSSIIGMSLDRRKDGNPFSLDSIVKKVKKIKPHFEIQQIKEEAQSLLDAKIILSK